MSFSEIINVKNIDHNRIIAGLIDEIGIVNIINDELGVDNREKINQGTVVKAMILNGLGMVSKPLYLFSKFFEDKAIEKLLGPEIKYELIIRKKVKKVKQRAIKGYTEMKMLTSLI